jgi:hypothetical protein
MMIKYTNQMKNSIFNVERKRSYTKKKGNQVHKYCNDIFTFDIEVTSAWVEDGKVIPYTKGKDNEYWNNLTPISLPYIWQFSFNDKVYYGRELYDFEKVLKDLPTDIEIIIWVHNLSYEFHFLSNFLDWKNVFAKEPHKPMKCTPVDYPNIEFRCSYMLTRLSLDAWGNQIGFKKATGDLDYETLRTPRTGLTDEELNYCERDCLVVYNGIKSYLKTYGNIRDIPLTQTGTVRRVIKDLLMEDKEYVKFIKKLVPHSAVEYKMLMDIFAGGFTHANKIYSGKVIRDTIEHYDFASSYPTVMISEKYPSTPWAYVPKRIVPTFSKLEETFDKYAYIMEIKFTNIYCVTNNTYIQASKCDGINMEYDNGRVLSADELVITCTEQDYLTIIETYEYDTIELLSLYKSVKAYLPTKLVDYILTLYGNKTSLKGVEGQEDLYMQSKQYINSLFGMSVTAIVQRNIKYKDGVWALEDLTEDVVNKKLDKLRHWAPREKRYFLSYSWGCWITAYARRNLWRCIESCDDEVLYCDTDSIFVVGRHNFDWYNNDIINKLKLACEHHKIDFNRTRPATRTGVRKQLGIFDKEDDCTEFITLGAKRYVERRKSDEKLHLTVSGINKDAVELLNDDITNFKDGFNFDKDSNFVSKRLCTYISKAPNVTFPDGYYSTYSKGINLRREGYLLTLTDEYKGLLEFLNMDIHNVSVSGLNKLKAYWRNNG